MLSFTFHMRKSLFVGVTIHRVQERHEYLFNKNFRRQSLGSEFEKPQNAPKKQNPRNLEFSTVY